MLILIVKDEHTQIPKEVASIDEARGFVEQGFTVFRIGDAGEKLSLDEPPQELETQPEPDLIAETSKPEASDPSDPAPAPAAKKKAAAKPAAKSTKKR